METALRVWDVFLCEGDSVLFRVALALLQLYERALCHGQSGEKNNGSVVSRFMNVGRDLFDADLLLSIACGGSYSGRTAPSSGTSRSPHGSVPTGLTGLGLAHIGPVTHIDQLVGSFNSSGEMSSADLVNANACQKEDVEARVSAAVPWNSALRCGEVGEGSTEPRQTSDVPGGCEKVWAHPASPEETFAVSGSVEKHSNSGYEVTRATDQGDIVLASSGAPVLGGEGEEGGAAVTQSMCVTCTDCVEPDPDVCVSDEGEVEIPSRETGISAAAGTDGGISRGSIKGTGKRRRKVCELGDDDLALWREAVRAELDATPRYF